MITYKLDTPIGFYSTLTLYMYENEASNRFINNNQDDCNSFKELPHLIAKGFCREY